MGNLYAGHIHLIAQAKTQADVVICSIFVNPTQFGANEDFGSYPRTLEADSQQLQAAACDLLFAPSAQEMYQNGFSQHTVVTVNGLSEQLCGQFRPTHFAGVATVVSKLFNIVQPDMAFLGEKDFQQLAVIRCLTTELAFPIEIVGVATQRAEDGLALGVHVMGIYLPKNVLKPHDLSNVAAAKKLQLTMVIVITPCYVMQRCCIYKNLALIPIILLLNAQLTYKMPMQMT